jgi:hypothetical protein
MFFDVTVRPRRRAPSLVVEFEDPATVKRYVNEVMDNWLRTLEPICHEKNAIGRARSQLLSIKESDFYGPPRPYLVARLRDLPGPNGHQ